jgi:hypothetical protein
LGWYTGRTGYLLDLPGFALELLDLSEVGCWFYWSPGLQVHKVLLVLLDPGGSRGGWIFTGGTVTYITTFTTATEFWLWLLQEQ